MSDLRIVHLALSPKAAKMVYAALADAQEAYEDPDGIFAAVRADIKEQLPATRKAKTKKSRRQ